MKYTKLIYLLMLFVCFLFQPMMAQTEMAEGEEMTDAEEELGAEPDDQMLLDSLHVDSITTMRLPVDSLSDSMIVARYRAGWEVQRVNPYQYPVDSIKDTFVVDCRGFCPPNLNVVTSEFGPRWGRFHAGMDMRLTVGDTIRAAFDGKVRLARSNPAFKKKGYGYFVMLQHSNGLETLYGHLSSVLVEPNQDVKAGDVIGLGGNTGRSTGPHLHFEFRFLGNPINPRNLLEVTEDTMVMKNPTYVVEKKASFKEFDAYLHAPAQYYKIRSGDNLGKIAKKYHTTVSKLCQLNRIKSTTILRVGRMLRVR